MTFCGNASCTETVFENVKAEWKQSACQRSEWAQYRFVDRHFIHSLYLNLQYHLNSDSDLNPISDRFRQIGISHKMASMSSVTETVSESVECFVRFVFVNGHRVIECTLSIFEGAAECKRFVVSVQMNRIAE